MRTIKFRMWSIKDKFMDDTPVIYKGIPCTIDTDGKVVWMPLDDTILMQFTGLYDRNGKEIYEGDIVLWGGIHNRVVKWEPYGYSPWACDGEGDHDCHAGWHVESEIIGNIYDNPELIK